jgi:peptide/nickel transport system substrate-binding protein
MDANYWIQRRASRRSVIRGLGVAGGLAIATPFLAACAGTKQTGSGGSASSSGSAAGGSAQPTGVLRMVHWQGPGFVDPLKEPNDDLIMAYGMGENLTRVTPDVKIAPWLAQSVESIDAVTTRVQLRSSVTFWDGSPVDAAAVKASIQRSWSGIAVAGALLPKDTQIETPDSLTIVFKTSQSQGNVPNNLAAPAFIIHKQAADNSIQETGAYKPTSIVAGQSISLQPYLQHWGEIGKISRIDAKIVPDANVRALALQSGDADFAWQLDPAQAAQLKGQFTIVELPSLRIDTAAVNCTRPPFNDLAVRRAWALAIDRDALVKGVLLGEGHAEYGCFPAGFSVESVQTQKYDLAQAKQILDQAGWTPGSDGVRQKNGARLSFTFFSYPGRPETKPITIAVQSQLKALGFDIKPQEVPDVKAAGQTQPDWGAEVSALNSLPTADPEYLWDYFYATDATNNYGHWSNAAFDALVKQLRSATDPNTRVALSRQIQQLMADDAPAAYLTSKVFQTGMTKKVSGLVVQPHDDYLITTSLKIQS